MKLDWPYDTCVACLKAFDETDPTGKLRRSEAHVIADSLGGKLRVTCLCQGCNNLIGTRYENELPLVEAFGHEMERFQELVPDFAKQLRKPGRSYVAPTEHGPLTLKRDKKGGELRVVYTKLDSGDFQDTRDAIREIRRRLTEQGVDSAEIEATVARLQAGETVQVGGHTYVPHSAELAPIFESEIYMGPDEAYLATAFLWLACTADKAIYSDELNGVRAALVGDPPEQDGSWQVEQLQTPNDSALWHSLIVRETNPAVVDITLFARWAVRVRFTAFIWQGQRAAYRLQVETGEEECVLLDDASGGQP